MRARVFKLLASLRSNYWFIPALMSAGAALLAYAVVWLDGRYGEEVLEALGWERGVHPDGARQMLTVIAGSMIAVASTVFSITVVAVVYATGQYGPRLLNNFLSDRGNKVALGTFIATFLYALLVLRTIRSPGEGGDSTGFVPDLAILVGVILAVVSVMVLIFFLHHAPSNIRIHHVIETIGRRILADIEHRFPRDVGHEVADEAAHDDLAQACAGAPHVTATASGYLQIVDAETLFEAACDVDAVIHLRVRPGRFLHEGTRLADVHGARELDRDTRELVRGAFALGQGRTGTQDLDFLFDELVEIALRALSPGVNDPFTATNSFDWMAAALAELARRPAVSGRRHDADGTLRIVVEPPSFADHVERTFGAVRQASATSTEAACGYLRALASAATGTAERPERLAVLREEAAVLMEAARLALEGPNLERVERQLERFERALSETPPALDAFA
jgi:uncharacterized membrane protein